MIQKKLFVVQNVFFSNFLIIFSLSIFFLYPQFSFSETVNTKNQSSIESIPFTFIGIESNKTVNPVLLEQSKDLSPARVIEVTSGVYTAIGYGPSNIIMVEGTDGVIMIDSGSSVDQAQTILSEFRKITDKPVSALIYTNGKADHVGGGGVFVNDSKTQGQLPDIIANIEFGENVFPSIGQIAKQKSIYDLYWSGLLLPSDNENDRLDK